MTEPLLLSATQISTFDGERLLTRASGFFFARDERLFLVTSRHVVLDEPSKHFPDRIEIELHIDADNLTRVDRPVDAAVSRRQEHLAPGRGRGRRDRRGGDRGRPQGAARRRCCCAPSRPSICRTRSDDVEVGSPLLIVGFPLGFHDTLHHLPVVRQAVIASSFGAALPGPGLLPHRRANPPRHQRRAGGHARPHGSTATASCRGSCSACTRRAWT